MENTAEKDATLPDGWKPALSAAAFTFQKLALFHRVAVLGSVTKAAEELGVAQPAVTAQLRAMERHLGVALVYRDGRNLALTEAGRSFHRWCEEMLARCDELSRTLSGLADGSTGHAVVAASMTAGTYRLSELLIRYQQCNPGTSITAQIGNTRATTEAVRAGTCDFAVLLLDPQESLDGLELEYLWEDPLWLVGPPAQVARLVAADADAIASLPFVTWPRRILRRTMEDEQLHAAGVFSRRIVMELGHPEAVKQAIKKGLGFTFIEASAVRDDIARGELAVLPTPSIALRLPVYLARRKDRMLSPMHLKLMAFILEECRRPESARSPAAPKPRRR